MKSQFAHHFLAGVSRKHAVTCFGDRCGVAMGLVFRAKGFCFAAVAAQGSASGAAGAGVFLVVVVCFCMFVFNLCICV